MRSSGPRPIHALRHHVRPALVLFAFLLGVLFPTTPAATPAHREFVDGPPSLCQGDPACLAQRWIEVDLAGFGGAGQRWMTYDPTALAHRIDRAALTRQSDESRAVRLLIAEVGVDRLATTRGGTTEALGLAYVVHNRLNESVANPKRIKGYRPYPGCGAKGTLLRCLNPGQFYGLATARALDPGRGARPDRLALALDIAVAAWRTASKRLAPDPTRGATEWVHRCGGAAYGARTSACDEASERAAGATAHDGPLVFKAPHRIGENGAYTLRETLVVPYRKGRPLIPQLWSDQPPA